MLTDNLLLLTDSYKASHWKQYPEGSQTVYSYMESRGGMFNEVVFFGLQYFLKTYLEGVVVTEEKINEAEVLINSHMGPVFNRAGWEHILNVHGGKLPIKIRAVKEGLVIPTGVPLITVENTDPEVPWLTNYLESLLLQVWYPITVATYSRECKKLIKFGLDRTTNYTDPIAFNNSLDFKMVDFGFRGVSSSESAMLGGAAHMLNFKSTDTMISIKMIDKIYGMNTMPGFSIPASEHSTITSWGRNHELDAFKNMLKQYPTGAVACVSDSYDITEAVRTLWPSLKNQIVSRDGVLIIRPDSGDIKMTLQVVLSELWKTFGGEIVNGYKTIDPSIRVIQGDGMNYNSLKNTISYIMDIGYSIENVAFGMGGALLQKVNRDTQKFAFKCSTIQVNDEWRDVFKAPTELDENGHKHASFKKSKTGKFSVVRGSHGIVFRPYTKTSEDLLNVVFENGKIIQQYNFDEIKQRAKLF